MEKKKRKDHRLKISQSDKLQALIRSENFLEDLKETLFPYCRIKPINPPGDECEVEKDLLKGEKLRELKKACPEIDFKIIDCDVKKYSPQKRITVEKKWGIIFPDGDSVEECLEFMQRPFEEGLSPETALNDPPIVSIVLPKPQVTIKRPSVPGERRSILMDYGNPLRDNRFLTLEIDLMQNINTDLILQKVEDTIRSFRKHVEKTKARRGATELDIWQIHDMVKKKNLKISEIARNLAGRKGTPKKDSILLSKKKATQYSFTKACNIIRALEREAHERASVEK